MEIVTGDRYLDSLVKFVEKNAGGLIDGTLVLKLNPVGLHYVQSRLEALHELERLIAGAPVDYLRAYVSDLGDHRALEQLRKILCRLPSLKVVSVLPPPARDPTPLSLLPFGRLKVLELRGCDLSNSAAKGLLELRHTLEKLICHNSTDALRHVFASRIVDIKESPQWTRLTFVSCACNGLVLMDESLQLLPAVETLDLSRNKFAIVDNLRKCTKLTHLDLGFNHLRSVASFREVTCHISKLVLRCNALTTLRGIESLKSIEQLDISYNIISNFHELEVLSSLPSLKNLWLEGNPVCCATWYRPQVFSFFAHPHQVKLDDREMGTREYWKRQIIFARRQRRPASFGFYSPAREGNEGEGLANRKRRKLSRVACIESDDHGMNMFLDHDSFSCDIETEDRAESVISDNEGEITSLINRIELMKKERSAFWLNDFKDWMDVGSQNVVDAYKNGQTFGEGNLLDKTSWRHTGESSRYADYASYSTIASGDDRSTIFFESNFSFAGSTAGIYGHPSMVSATENWEVKPRKKNIHQEEDHLKFPLHKGENHLQVTDYDLLLVSMSITGSQSSSVRSPPHYQEDILQRRHCLEEELYQLSAESFSAASSDSDTSCEEDSGVECMSSSHKFKQFVNEDLLGKEIEWHLSPYLVQKDDVSRQSDDIGQHAWSSLHSCSQQGTADLDRKEDSIDVPAGGINDEVDLLHKNDADNIDKKNSKRKPKRRVVSLSEDKNRCPCGDVVLDKHKQHTLDDCTGRACRKFRTPETPNEEAEVLGLTKPSAQKPDDNIEEYFNSCVADNTVHETCMQYILSGCIADEATKCGEREVAVILSSEFKLYVLLFCGMLCGSENSLSLLSSHKVEEVGEVFVGLGLQVVRLYIDGGVTHILVTRSVEKTRHLLHMIEFVSHGEANRYSLRSLELMQINLFDKQVCGGLGISIYQYCMVLFWHNHGGKEWTSRSIFVCGGHLFVCTENLLCFSLLATNNEASSYFSLDSCCSIARISEMVIETEEHQCTLSVKEDPRMHCLSAILDTVKGKAGIQDENKDAISTTWKLKWFCAESLSKFVALLKAFHAQTTTSNLSVRYIS